MTTLRWLHLTDLHLGMKDLGLWAGSKDALLDDLTKVAKRGPIDLVLFTGDLAFSGAADPYKQIDAALDAILGVLRRPHVGVAEPVLIAVPGNHDLVRPSDLDPCASSLSREEKFRQALWSGDKGLASTVSGWFAGYSSWWSSREKLLPAGSYTKGLLPGDFLYTHEKAGARIGLVGMNSAFLDISNAVGAGELWMDVRQLGPACANDLPAWLKTHNVSFLLTHHPTSWLSPQSLAHYKSEIARPGAFAAHLCGHLHESYAEARRVGGGEERQLWQAPSLFGLEKLRDGNVDRKHGYTLGELEITDAGVIVRRWPRLAVRSQDGAYRVTADVTYKLKDDLLEVPEETLGTPRATASGTSGRAPAKTPAKPPAPTGFREAVTSSPLWASLDPAADASEASRREERIRIAGEIAEACWAGCIEAQTKLPGDPWRDERYPIRVLERLERLIGRERPKPDEVFLLVVAPFVREAIFAAGALWMEAANPLDVVDKNAPAEPRNTLEQLHRSRPDLLRRVEKLAGAERDALCFWMMSQALQRSPHLWDPEPKLPSMRELQRRIQAVVSGSTCAGWLGMDLLIRLAWCVGMPPQAFEGESGIERWGVIERAGTRLRLPALACLLSVAGLEALDLRTADELVVDHTGRDDLTPTALRDALRSARWSEPGGRHHLEATCEHPAIDFAIDDLVARARAASERIRSKSPDITSGLLGELPAGIAADLHPAVGADGRPRYARPLVRFRLDHHRIRELLMGEQLYGDPTLAVRELYQNALDACRYRRARATYLQRKGEFFEPAPYEGRIAFRQGLDAAGRAYIECEDNGVGMTAAVLEQVFAVAGRRFRDLPEFVEEAALWQRCDPPVELYPNSQFGVGVMSYFMLAEELEIRTRRYERDGRLGKPLIARISSASGLFRLEEGRHEEMPEAGTRVRLLLSRTSYEDGGKTKTISAHDTLGRLLWIAEFETTIDEEGREWLRWPAGVPAPGGKPAPEWQFRATADADVFWATSCAVSLPDYLRDLDRPAPDPDFVTFPILADGIISNSRGSCILINLRGKRYPKLSIDRKTIVHWDASWVQDILQTSVPELPNWAGLTFVWLWHFEQNYITEARTLFAILIDRDARLPLSPENLDTKSAIRSVGCFGDDPGILRRYLKGDEPENRLEAWRYHVWFAAGADIAPASWIPSSFPPTGYLPRPEPGDSCLLGFTEYIGRAYYGRAHPSVLVTLPFETVQRASKIHRSTEAFLSRFAEFAALGIEFGDEWDAERAALRHFLAMARSRRVEESTTETLDSLDLSLLSVQRSHIPSWIEGDIPAGHIVYASVRLKIPMSEVLHRLEKQKKFGIRLPAIDFSQFDQLDVNDYDVILLSWNLDGLRPWLQGNVPIGWIRHASAALHWKPEDIVRRLESFKVFGIHPQTTDWSSRSEHQLSLEEKTIIAIDTDSDPHAIASDASAFHFVAVAARHRCSLGHVFDVALRLEVLSASLHSALRGLRDYEPDEIDLDLLRYHAKAEGRDQETRNRRAMAEARFYLWQISQEELETRAERLKPILDLETADPAPGDPAT